MSGKRLLELLDLYFDPDRACAHADIIFSHDKWNSFNRYNQTADYLEEEFKNVGADEVERFSIPCDGEYQLGDWIMPFAWDAEEGILELLNTSGERHMLLADYRAVPNSLIRWSRPTSPEGEVLELVYIPDARKEENWADKDIKGKLVFTHVSPSDLYSFAVKHHASGIISDFSTSAEDFPKAVHWCNVWTSHFLWGTTKYDKPLLGFSLSPEKGRKLSEIISHAKGNLRVKALVKANLYKGNTDVISAAIKGDQEPEKEIVFYSHVYECQIDDNAVAAGMYIEAVRILKQLVESGKIPRPRRTIRFVCGWEWIGSMYYAMFCKRNRQWIASACYDACAMDQKYTKEPIRIHTSPGFNSSFADVLFIEKWKEVFARHLPLVSWERAPWSGGSDNRWVDPDLGNVSNVWPYQYTGSTWHKSHTTIGMINRDVLKYSCLTSLVWAFSLATAAAQEARYFAKLSANRISGEIRKYAEEIDFNRSDVELAKEELRFIFKYLQEKAKKTIDTSALAPEDKELRNSIEMLCQQTDRLIAEEQEYAENQLAGKAKTIPSWQLKRPDDYLIDRERKVADNIIPQRVLPGVLRSFSKFSADELKEFQKRGGFPEYFLLLSNGKQSLLEIARKFRFDQHTNVNLRNLIRNARLLEKAGYLRLSYRKVFTVKDLVDDLKHLGIKTGDTVLVHSSLSAIGPLENGPDTVFHALEGIVGKSGTVVFPSFAFNNTQNYPDSPYDVKSTLTRVGRLSNLFLKRPGVVRSKHPSHGMAATGKNAAYIIEDNLPYSSFDIQGAFGKLYALDAKIIMIGCGLTPNTTLHVIEDWANLPSMTPDKYHYLDENGKRLEIIYDTAPLGHRGFYTPRLSDYERLFREKGIIAEGRVGLATSFLMRTREVINYGMDLVKNNSFDVLICTNPDCSDCSRTRKTIMEQWTFPSDILDKMKALS